MSYQKHLIKDKRFWPTFWTQFFGALNDNVFKNALVILITFKSFSLGGLNSEAMVALCGGIFILPFFLFSAVAGKMADKIAKNALIQSIKLAEIIIMGVATLGLLTNSITLLLITLFLMGTQSAFFGPVKYSILPEIIEKDELIQGNALFEMGTFLAILMGTILGGSLIAMQASEYIVSAAVLVFSIIGFVFSKKISPLPAVTPEAKFDFSIFRPTFELLKLAKSQKGNWNSILGISWFWFLGAALLSLFPGYAKDVLQGDNSTVTLLLAIFSIGVALGSFLCEKLSKERLELGLVPIGSIGMTLFIFDLTTQTENIILGRILFDIFMLSVFSGFFIVPLYTFIQERSKDKERSQMIAANNIVNAAFMVVSSLFLSFLFAKKMSYSTIFLILGGLNTIVACYIYTVIPEFLLRFCVMCLSRLIYRLDILGLKNIPEEGPAVLVCNHVSFVDWLIIAAAIKRPIRFVMHHSFMKIPLLSFIFKGAKVIPIASKKENAESYQQAFTKIQQELQEGELICIFPEGKITSDGKLNTYKAGIEKIISQSPVPVVPMVLKGLWGSFFSRKYGKALSKPSIIRKTLFSKIELIIEKPIQPENVSAAELEEQTLKMIS